MRSPTGFDELPPPRVTRIRLGLLWVGLLLIAAVAGTAYLYLKAGGFQRMQELVDRDSVTGPAWLKQQIKYPVDEPDHKVAASVRDLNAERLAALAAQLAEMKASMEALKNRPPPTPPGKPAAAPAPKPKYGSMLFIHHEIKTPEIPAPNTYSLAPGQPRSPVWLKQRSTAMWRAISRRRCGITSMTPKPAVTSSSPRTALSSGMTRAVACSLAMSACQRSP